MARALLLTEPGRLDLVERQRPAPEAEEVVVRVAYAGICHTDQYLLAGVHPTAELPCVPGHELSGTVVTAGTHARAREGDRVAVVTHVGDRELGSTRDGGWQDFVVIPAVNARALPPEVTLLAGALVEPAANGHAAARSAAIAPGETVLVLGPGAIGLLALQCARLFDPGRIVLAGLEQDAERLALGRDLGADATVAARPEQLESELRDALGAHGADVVLQCAPSIGASATALALLAEGGRVVIEGYAGSRETVAVSPDAMAVRSQRLIGLCGWTDADFDAAIGAAAAGRLALEPLVSERFALPAHAAAIDTATAARAGTLKVVFALDGEG